MLFNSENFGHNKKIYGQENSIKENLYQINLKFLIS